MTSYPIFNEIAAEIKARSDTPPAEIIEEYIAPLVDVCNDVNQWIGGNFAACHQPQWYDRFVINLARFDVDLSPIWSKARSEVAE